MTLNTLTLPNGIKYYVPGGKLVQTVAASAINQEKFYQICTLPSTNYTNQEFILEIQQGAKTQTLQCRIISWKQINILFNSSLPTEGFITRIGITDEGILWFAIKSIESFNYSFQTLIPDISLILDQEGSTTNNNGGYILDIDNNIQNGQPLIIFGTGSPPTDANYIPGTIYVQYSS